MKQRTCINIFIVIVILAIAVSLLVHFIHHSTKHEVSPIDTLNTKTTGTVTISNDNNVQTSTSNQSVFSNMNTSLNIGRSDFGSILLPNGHVLIAGGHFNSSTVSSGTEVYTSTGWQFAAPMKVPRGYHTVTAFANNTKVLAAGSSATSGQQTAEVYNAVNNTWALTSINMLSPHIRHTATLLANGQILIAGGYNISGGVNASNYLISTAELYINDSWTLLSTRMTHSRAFHAAVLLNDGTVLVAGGGDGTPGAYPTAEIYNATSEKFTAVGSMQYRRAAFTLTLLPSGKVLAIGGADWSSGTYPLVCELYDPVTRTWSNNAMLNYGRSYHQSVLTSSFVLTMGGTNGNNNRLNSSEKYNL
ncbi:unnamed protein product [Adineta steineri]|uniref:Uncharacterized protein n=1 Tax=Adineta steineri TaxID=433720 RepID=A0A814YT91_9BILA|nr:unnamed protein product [Adineta steineri]CAF1527947.1 unnamed protein product [Adineta steineri]